MSSDFSVWSSCALAEAAVRVEFEETDRRTANEPDLVVLLSPGRAAG